MKLELSDLQKERIALYIEGRLPEAMYEEVETLLDSSVDARKLSRDLGQLLVAGASEKDAWLSLREAGFSIWRAGAERLQQWMEQPRLTPVHAADPPSWESAPIEILKLDGAGQSLKLQGQLLENVWGLQVELLIELPLELAGLAAAVAYRLNPSTQETYDYLHLATAEVGPDGVLEIRTTWPEPWIEPGPFDPARLLVGVQG